MIFSRIALALALLAAGTAALAVLATASHFRNLDRSDLARDGTGDPTIAYGPLAAAVWLTLKLLKSRPAFFWTALGILACTLFGAHLVDDE